jgi:hypothetical protein
MAALSCTFMRCSSRGASIRLPSARAEATVGEICAVLGRVFGKHKETITI